jgi:hypothetical protein
MKKLIYALYVAAVLLFSAFARAELAMPFSKILPKQTPVTVTDVGFDEASFNLAIDGFKPNRCYPTPFAVVVQNQENPNVLKLRLTSPTPTNPCPSRIEKYSTVVNLPVLVQNARLVLEPNAKYVVEIEGYKYELQVLGSELMKVPGFVSFQ